MKAGRPAGSDAPSGVQALDCAEGCGRMPALLTTGLTAQPPPRAPRRRRPPQKNRRVEHARPPYSRCATLRQSGDVCHDDERNAESGKRHGGDTSGTDRPAGSNSRPGGHRRKRCHGEWRGVRGEEPSPSSRPRCPSRRHRCDRSAASRVRERGRADKYQSGRPASAGRPPLTITVSPGPTAPLRRGLRRAAGGGPRALDAVDERAHPHVVRRAVVETVNSN